MSAAPPMDSAAAPERSRAIEDEFYVGYAPPMPPGLARVARRTSASLCVGAVVLAVAVAAGHVPIDGGTFEFGRTRQETGTLAARPYPSIVPDGAAGERGSVLLVAPGKHGADDLVAGLDGARVRLEGTRIERDGLRMLEVVPGSVAPIVRVQDSIDRPMSPPAPGDRVTLRGEIVDSKCFLGVMVPGAGRTHAACAALCLRGGIPPALLVRDRAGRSSLLLLEGPDGQPLAAAAAGLAGVPVAVPGVRGSRGGWETLRTDPSTWTRLAGAGSTR